VINRVALFKRFVKFELADHATQRGLRKLRDRQNRAAGAVGCESRIRNLEVQNAIDLQLRVVLGDTHLWRHVERHLAQVVPGRNAVYERNGEAQARLKNGVEAAQPLND